MIFPGSVYNFTPDSSFCFVGKWLFSLGTIILKLGKPCWGVHFYEFSNLYPFGYPAVFWLVGTSLLTLRGVFPKEWLLASIWGYLKYKGNNGNVQTHAMHQKDAKNSEILPLVAKVALQS